LIIAGGARRSPPAAAPTPFRYTAETDLHHRPHPRATVPWPLPARPARAAARRAPRPRQQAIAPRRGAAPQARARPVARLRAAGGRAAAVVLVGGSAGARGIRRAAVAGADPGNGAAAPVGAGPGDERRRAGAGTGRRALPRGWRGAPARPLRARRRALDHPYPRFRRRRRPGARRPAG